MDPITHIHAKDLRSLPRTHQRSKFIDYKGRGIYLITLCTEGRRPLLGELCGDSPERAYVRPSALGQAVLRCWQDIPAVQRGIAAQRSLRLGTTCTRDIQLLSCQLMPDHFHGIIFIRQDMDIALGQVVYGFMVGCTRAYHALLSSTNSSMVQPGIVQQPANLPASPPTAQRSGSTVGIHTDQSSMVQPSLVQQPASPPTPLRPLWEKGFHDRPLKRRGQLENMLRYVADNPRRLYIRRHHARNFHVQQAVRVGECCFSAVGNLLLLDNALHVVHVRRRFSPEERRRYMNNCVLAARQGRVLISPFISEYEKQVRDVVLQEGYPVIQLTNEALSHYYKPSGDLFHACANGQLLLLSTNNTSAPFGKRITREECNTLNALAEALATGEYVHSM